MISTGSFPKALQGKAKKQPPPPLSSYGGKKGKKKAC